MNKLKYIALIITLMSFISPVYAMEKTPSDAAYALADVIRNKDVEEVRKKLEQGYAHVVDLRIKPQDYRPSEADYGATNYSPLSVAVAGGNDNIVWLLLAKGRPNVNLKLDNGWSPLHIAVRKKYVNIVRMLLRQGAQLYSINGIYGFTPLHEAAYLGDRALLHAIITQIPQTKISSVILPLLCCFKRFARGEGASVVLPMDLRLKLCSYALRARIHAMASEQIEVLQPVLKLNDNYGKTPIDAVRMGAYVHKVGRFFHKHAEVSDHKGVNWGEHHGWAIECLYLRGGLFRYNIVTEYLWNEFSESNIVAQCNK